MAQTHPIIRTTDASRSLYKSVINRSSCNCSINGSHGSTSKLPTRWFHVGRVTHQG